MDLKQIRNEKANMKSKTLPVLLRCFLPNDKLTYSAGLYSKHSLHDVFEQVRGAIGLFTSCPENRGIVRKHHALCFLLLLAFINSIGNFLALFQKIFTNELFIDVNVNHSHFLNTRTY